MAKKDEKTMLFRLLRKSSHYFCLEFVKNESSYGPLKFCENCMPEKNLVLKWWPKWLLANKISVFFNQQYFINRLISDFDFWNVDRHEW